MKLFLSLALLPCFVLPVACTQTNITHGKSTVAFKNFASRTKAEKIRVGGDEGIAIDGWDDDATQVAALFLKEVSRAWRNYMILKGIEYIGDKYYMNKTQELNAQSTVNLEKLRNAKSAQDQAHALEVLKATPPEPVAAAASVVPVPAT